MLVTDLLKIPQLIRQAIKACAGIEEENLNNGILPSLLKHILLADDGKEAIEGGDCFDLDFVSFKLL